MRGIHKYAGQAGESIAGFLVSAAIGLTILSLATGSLFTLSKHTTDQESRTQVHTEARAVADLMAYEIRLLGSGVPFTLGNFQMTTAGIGTASFPIMTSSTASSITFRANEKGKYAMLTTQYTPSASSLVIQVNDGTIFNSGDEAYISEISVGGTDGLSGTVLSSTSTTVSIASNYKTVTGAIFSAGSTIEPVKLITFTSPNDQSGITRNDSSSTALLSPRSSFTLTYRNATGATMTLPLTTANIKDSLTSLQLVVSVSRTLRTGATYTAIADHTIALRNLIASR